MNIGLAGKTAIVSGASSGLGAYFAKVLGEAGANVVLGARRIDRVNELARNLERQGIKAMAVQLDVTDELSISRALDEAKQKFGTVNVVVANAGISRAGRSTEVPVEDLSSILNTNLLGTYLTVRQSVKRMLAQPEPERQGRVVIIGSITADQTDSGDAMYAASKAAVAHLGRNFAREWVRLGINVNVIQPGYIRSELAGEFFDTPAGQDLINNLPRRKLQEMESLASQLIYLCSSASSSITGAVLNIDDGQSL